MPPSSIGTAHHPYPGGESALIISGSNRVSKLRITDGALELIDQVIIPGYEEQNASEREVRELVKAIGRGGTDEGKYLPPLQAYLTTHGPSGENLPYGLYTVLDRGGNYFSGWGTTVYKVVDEKPKDIRSKLRIVKSFDLKHGLPPKDAGKINRLFGLNMTYDGHLVVAMPGIVAVLDLDLSDMKYILLEGEAIDNGVTVDDAGGIYVVTSKYMRKVIWNGKQLSDRESDGAWKSKYDYVPNPPSHVPWRGQHTDAHGLRPQRTALGHHRGWRRPSKSCGLLA